MATNAPSHPCFICGGKLEWEVVEHHREPWEPVLYGPTDWRQLPHECPPGAAEKFYAEAFERGRQEKDKPFFTRVQSPQETSS
jgi:hypothetical protein